MEEPITPAHIKVRHVTHYQFSWTEEAPGQPGTFTVQLILDQGADEYVLRLVADDADVLFELFDRGKDVYFDTERKVLMFGSRGIG